MALSASSGRSPDLRSNEYQRHYLKLFVNRVEPVMRATRGRWFTDHCRLKAHELQWAITGEMSLGLYAVSKTGKSKWLCLDADTPESFSGLGSITATMTDQDNILLERSRRGGHLWFFCPPTPWEEVANYGHYLVMTFGLQKIEVFPKNPGLNGVKAPATRHPKTGLVYPFVDIQTGELHTDHRDVILALRPRALPRVFYREEPAREQRPLPFPAGAAKHGDLLREVERYTTLRHIRDDRYRGKCPFHGPDNNPSFGVSGIIWQCWTCGISGRLADFQRIVKERGL